MPELGGLTISVDVDGQPLEEYGVQKDGQSISCHIVSAPGQTFGVKVLNNSPLVDAAARIAATIQIFIDGTTDGSTQLLAQNSTDLNGQVVAPVLREWTVKGFRVNQTTIKRFCFSRVELTEDTPSKTLNELDDIGTIKAKVRFYRVQGSMPYVHRPTSEKPAISVSERAKKGGGHCTGLGEEMKSAVPSSCSGGFCDDMPTYEFVFRHSSRYWLQAKEIIKPQALHVKPDPASPIASTTRSSKREPVKRERETASETIDILSDSDEEDHRAMKKIQEKVAARKRAKLAVKPEPKTNIASSGDAAVIDISD